MPITTTTALTITTAERDRVNAQVSALQTALAAETDRAAALAAQVSALQAELAARPPSPPPVPPPPASQARTGLYVDGATLRTKSGQPVGLRGIELMWGPTASGNTTTTLNAIRSFGANAIGPLFQPGAPSSAASVQACIAGARARGMIVGVNSDHTGEGRAWMLRPEIVAVCNTADNVFLQCEVEQGDGQSLADWRADAIAFVRQLRNAGHKSPIKVGSPLGGRLPMFALQAGADVLAADPLRSLLFTWQAYWKASTAGWQYSNEAGFASGTAGALACADAVAASGLCFVVGLDGADDVGPTPYAELAARLHQHGVGWQWWAWMVGDSYGNGLVADTLSSTPKAPFGTAVRTLLQAQSVLPTL